MSIEIIPAILPRDFDEVRDKIDLVTGLVDTVQIDICDGQFVPNATWPYRKHDDTFERLISQKEGMPHWEDLNFEFDLMMNFGEEEDILNWINAGASRLILHIESKGDLQEMIRICEGVELSLALNEETPLERLQQFMGISENINNIQIMGIDNIGFQGQKFDEKVLIKIKEARLMYPEINITVDGGVSLHNAQDLVNAGANRLVVGSAIYNSDSVVDAIQEFQNIVSFED